MPKMKDSGIEWIGMIPDDWKVEKAKFYFTCKKYIPGVKSVNYERLALTLKGVIKRSKDDTDGLQPKDFQTYQLLKKDELVFKLIDLQNISTSRVGLAKSTGLVSPAYIVLHAKDEIYPQYAEKFYLIMWYKEIFNALGDDGVRSSINASELLNIPILIPPFNVQKIIVEFLEKKCLKIDSLNAEIQSQINALEQYKKSVISETVRKGLDFNVELKDSGIEWIGEIPKHWEVDKIKYHLKRNEPKNPGGVQVLSVYREYGVIPKDSRDDNHNVTSEDTSKYKYIKPGNLVINKMKAWQGSLAVSNYEGIVSPAYFVYKFTSSKLEKFYFHYLIRSCYNDEFRRISGGIREGQWDLSSIDFENELILLPPIDEQKSIVNYINQKISDIEKLIADKKEQIKILTEYKQSLIFEYVTGKKEVIEYV